MAKRRDDYLINLVIASQNLASEDIDDLDNKLKDISKTVDNLNQSERKRTDTITAAQRESGKLSKETERLIQQGKEGIKINEKEIESIEKRTEATRKETNVLDNFLSKVGTSVNTIKRDIERSKLEFETQGIKSSLIQVTETIENLQDVLQKNDKNLSEAQEERTKQLIQSLKSLQTSYRQELRNLGLSKEVIASIEKQIKTSEKAADADRKRAAAKEKLLKLYEQEKEVSAAAAAGTEKEAQAYKKWQGDIDKTKRELESLGVTREDLQKLEADADRSSTERVVRLARARLAYAKEIEKENKVNSESISLNNVQVAQIELIKAKKEQLRKEIQLSGGSVEDLDTRNTIMLSNLEEGTKRNVTSFGRLRNLVSKIRTESSVGPTAGFGIAFRDAANEASVLSRRLGRLGLAIRGLAIVGVLGFMQSFISVLGAAGAQVTALVSSLISAAGAVVVSFIPAIAQAIPIVGLLGSAFSRLGAIQEAVNQADLAKKQAFGDTAPEQQATDAALQIADAQRGVKEAQEQVTEARKEAKKELQDLILQEKQAELAFKSSILSQAEARKALQETIASGDIESLARDQLSVEESIFDRARARRELREARGARRRGQRGGVEGTETYKNAIKSLADAQRNLAQAQRSTAIAADTQSAAQSNLAFFLSQLSAAERKLFKQFMGLRARYQKVFRPITDIIINAFSRGLVRAEKLIFSSGIVNGFRRLAQVLAKALDRISVVLTSPAFKQFFVTTLSDAAKNVPLITSGFILLADIFRKISIAAAPVLRQLLEFIVDKLGELNNTVSNTGALTEFFMMGEKHFEAWIELIISVLSLLGQVMQASSSSALETITSLTDTINGAADALKSDDTGARNFFDDAAESAKIVGNVILELGKAIVELTSSRQVKALADIFTEALIPGMVMGVKVVGLLALGFDKLLENDLIAKLFQIGVAGFFIGAAWTSVAAIFKPAFVLIKGIAFAFSKLGASLVAFIAQISAVSNALGGRKASFLNVLKAMPTAIKDAGGFLAVFRKGLAAIPVVGWIVVAVIEVIIGAIMALKDNFWGVTDAMKEALGGLGDAFNNLFAAFGGEGEGSGGFKLILDVLGKILSVIGDIVGFIGKVVGAIALFAIIKGIIEPITAVINTIADAVNVWSTFVNDIKKDGLGKALKNLGKNILKYIFTLVGRVLALVFRLPLLAGKGIIALVKAAWSGIKKLFSLLIKSVVASAKFVFNAIKTLLSPKSFGNILANVAGAIGKFFSNLPNLLSKILKVAGKAIWEGLILGLGAGTVEKIVNIFIDIVNAVIDSINAASPFGDIEKLDEFKMPEKPSGGPKSKTDAGGRGRARDIDAETESQKRSNKAKKDSAKFSLGNYKALNLNAGASRRNARLNNALAGSLDKSSKAHRKAQRLQEALNRAAERGRDKQRAYAESIRKTAAAEERMARALSRAKGSRKDINERERSSVKIRTNLQEKTREVARAEANFTDRTKKASTTQDKYRNSLRGTYRAKINYGAITKINIDYQTKLNARVRRGESVQDKYAKSLKFSTKQTENQQKEIRQLTRKFGMLNRVLRITGENSRSLGVVFKSVTNKLLNEFNVEPLKVKIPEVSGIFKKAMGGTEGFQRGGYFGDKKLRRKDDRLIKVAGGEAILTGYHQPEVNKALAFANAHGVTDYNSLDSMFSREKRPHYTAPSDQTGGPGDSNYRRRRRSRRKKSEGSTPMGYAWRGDSPQGLKEAVRKIAGATMYKFPFLTATSTLRDDPGSHHGVGEAVDLATTPYSKMNQPAIWVGSTFGRALEEGIFNPSLSISDGQKVPSSFWGSGTWNAHADHIHVAALGGEITAGGLPMGMLTAPQIKRVKVKAPKNSIGALLQGQSDTLRSGANKKLKKEFNAGNMIGMDGGVLTRQQVAAIAKRALQIVGLPPTKESIRRLVWLAYKESGFNPKSINNWDSNAAAGDPSRGLMQTIGATFNAYKLPKYGNIWNPLHNMIASIRYQMARYNQLVTWTPYSGGGLVPEFDTGGIVPGPIGSPQLIKAHGGETILPTHKFNRGGMVPTYQRGGVVPDVPDVTRPQTVGNDFISLWFTGRMGIGKIKRKIDKLRDKIKEASTQAEKIFYKEQLQDYEDRLLLARENKKMNKEIAEIRKKIRQQERKLRKAEGKERKEIKDRLKNLNRQLRQAQSDRNATVAFEGDTYNLKNVREFTRLINDRLKSFFKNIEETTRKLALATAKWSFKVLKIDGKLVVSRVNSAVKEAQRGLKDLFAERGAVIEALRETERAEAKARDRLKKERKQNDKKLNNLQERLEKKLKEKRKNKDDKEKEKRLDEEIKQIRKEIEDQKKQAKEDEQALQTAINSAEAKRQELLEKEAELVAAIYEQQQAIFEAQLEEFDSQFTALDTQIEIATLRNQDAGGNLTEAGRAEVMALYGQRGEVFAAQRRFLEEQLAQATAAQDVERQKALQQALLENELAVLQNTQSIKELDGSITGVFDFQSTNWEKFRQAIFTGSGPQLLPEFASTIPQLASGGYITKSGMAYLHAAEVVVPASQTGNMGPLIDTINFTEPMEVADPIALSNQIGFKLSTLKSSE